MRRGTQTLGRSIARAATATALAATAALACGWPATDQSVRFNSFARSEADFARLPPLGRGREPEARSVDEADRVWDEAVSAIGAGDLAVARARLREFLEASAGLDGSEWHTNLRERRNSAVDMLDALGELDRGAPAVDVRSYLEARRLYDDNPGWLPDAAPRDARLRDNYAYLVAADAYRSGNHEAAELEFNRIAREFPGSEKREAAIYMFALSTLKRSACYARATDGVDEPPADASVRDGAWHTAREGFLWCLREYPKGRYAAEARGWLAFLSWHSGDRAEGLAGYYRLTLDPDLGVQSRALKSLRIVRDEATEADMKRVEALLEREPAAALAYAYYELYDYLPQYDVVPCSYGECYEGCDGEVRVDRPRELSRLAAFATRMADRAPGAAGPAFALRAAMANLELGAHETASRLARRALSLGARGEERIHALWVAGAADRRRGMRASARAAFEQLLAAGPSERLAEGARRHLAMIAEDEGDMGGALEQYLALGYQLDVAYLVDVVMTPEELERFVTRDPLHPRRDALWYALGVRYLREWRFDDARRAYANVRTVSAWEDRYYNARWGDPDGPASPKDPDVCDWAAEGVRAQWVARDLQTVEDLERLSREAEGAATAEAEAEARYQLASYLFEAGTLVFYNSEAWRGSRYRQISELGYAFGLRLPGEDDLLWRYMKEHENLSRALDLYLEVVDRFPETKAARDALYTAAVCHERLSNYNYYWREAYGIGRHAGSRMVTYDDVRRAYPDYQLPQGTYGWEPSTRTVNGGPGWDAPPPRPEPQPAWRRYSSRALTLAAQWSAWAWAGAIGYLRWLVGGVWRVYSAQLVLLAFACAAYAWWRAARAAARVRREVDAAGGYPRAVVARTAARLASGWRAMWAAVAESREFRDGLVLAVREPLRRMLWFALRTRAGLYLVLYGLPALGILLLLASFL